jgi:PAS domain S-box-containing protein
MSKKYIFTILLMVLIVTLASAALMLAILRQEISNEYYTLKAFAENESSLLSHLAEDRCKNAQNVLQCIYELIDKNRNAFTFSETGDTIIAKQIGDQFTFLYSSRTGDLSSSAASNLNDAFQSEFMRALLFGESPILIGRWIDNKKVLSAYTQLVVNNNNLLVITKINMDELMAPFYRIVLKCLAAEFVLLVIGTIFIVFMYTKSLRKEVKRAAAELTLSKNQIKELQNIEKSLADIKQGMEEALEVSLFGFWHYDFASSLSIRSAIHDKIFGYDALLADWNFDTLLSHIVEDEKENVRKAFNSAVSGNGNHDIDISCRITRKEGEIRWIWLKGKKREDGSLIGIIRDITSRKKMEQEVLDIRNHLEELVAKRTSELETEKQKLQTALSSIKTLKELLPICSGCGKIRDDNGYWNKVETYIVNHTDTKFSHGLCPDCVNKFYPALNNGKAEL